MINVNENDPVLYRKSTMFMKKVKKRNTKTKIKGDRKKWRSRCKTNKIKENQERNK